MEQRGPVHVEVKEVVTARGLTMSLGTPIYTVEKLRTTLHAKAKAEVNYRFYSLWDKIYRADVLREAWRRVRANRGSSGIDGVTFAQIEVRGAEVFLASIQKELRENTYSPQPLRRVWIPKVNGSKRPLGIPTIKDRVVQTALVLIVGAIFEADFPENQYGFREVVDAKMAVRMVFWHMSQRGRSEVVDADIKDYFNQIPHGPLLKSVARRIADKNVLSLIKAMLEAPVVEEDGGQLKRTSVAKDTHRGTPQGGPASPLLANIYFRRVLVAWNHFGLGTSLNARIVNYADDFVICCEPGNGENAYSAVKKIIETVGLELHPEKTQVVSLPEGSFDFLGYCFKRCFTHKGRAYIGTVPSTKAMKKMRDRVREETSPRWLYDTPEKRVKELNYILRGWSNYFDQGPVIRAYQKQTKHVEFRLRRWLARKFKSKRSMYKRFPDAYLYGKLGLYRLAKSRAEMPRAKACHT